jgi:hypothetical protein
LALFVGGVVLLFEAKPSPLFVASDYFPGVCGVAAGVFGLALAGLVEQLHQLYSRAARAEFELSKRRTESDPPA